MEIYFLTALETRMPKIQVPVPGEGLIAVSHTAGCRWLERANAVSSHDRTSEEKESMPTTPFGNDISPFQRAKP
jgi:hypothetical protein